MTQTVNTRWPRAAIALLVFQAAVQAVAFALDRLQIGPLVQLLSFAGLAAAAVAGSAWLGQRSRQQGKGFIALMWALVIVAVLVTVFNLFETYGIFMFPEDYSTATLVWIYAEKAIKAAIWLSIAAAFSLRLWAFLALAFHTAIVWMTAGLLPGTRASSLMYGWDRNPEALSAVMTWFSAVSLTATLLVVVALVWQGLRLRTR